ncbi:MAG: primosomal protein N' [Gammaproteobacteria bacterium]|nr:primosomal protein N' [Gammaproteobacteria bacterium]
MNSGDRAAPREARILEVAVLAPVRGLFDYLAPATGDVVAVGSRVLVPFGGRRRVGVVVGTKADSALGQQQLKAATECLDRRPHVDASTLELVRWAADYYHYPIGEVMAAALPGGLRAPRPFKPAQPRVWKITAAGREQLAAGPGRAPRQFQLLTWLAEQPIYGDSLPALDFDLVPVVRRLQARGLVVQEAAEPRPSSGPPADVVLNEAQRHAAGAIVAGLGRFGVALLDGVTGSGKTEVYIESARAALARGGQVLMLVPEIALTQQTIRRLAAGTGAHVAAFHSGMTPAARSRAWQSAATGAAGLVIGTRSALWTVMPRLALIVIDEEHDASYKQSDGFRYSARDVAVMLGRMREVPVVLGSATPSGESLANVEAGKYQRLALPERVAGAAPPLIRIVDMCGQNLVGGLAPALAAALEARLARGEQSILFLNRRGYAPVLLCHQCGWSARCGHCDAALVYHKRAGQLVCHHCGQTLRFTGHADCCAQPELVAVGTGTQRLEETLSERFPAARVVRIDRDAVRQSGQLEQRLGEVADGSADIVVGTQMMAKGHDFPLVTLVGVVDADDRLYSADYRATERLAQLLLQVAGRAGRAERAGEVLIQTHQPGHPVLADVVRGDYHGFMQATLAARRAAELPPYAAMALLRAEAPGSDLPAAFLRELGAAARQSAPPGIAIFGPLPAPMERRAGRYRWQLVLQAAQRPALQAFLGEVIDRIETMRSRRGVRWSLDVDPLEML